ncbi:MAG: STAS-like domain-containing protein [Holophagaceae bacterium]|nr:STAS-like domain-containing protein [Holophagaceae bacterium]
METANKIIFSIARAFSRTPGPRYRDEGKKSGQELREDHIIGLLNMCIKDSKQLEINLDGTAGYATSFLEEAFGGLIRNDKFNLETLKSKLKFVSTEEDYLIDDIWEYIQEADRENRNEK